MKPKLKPISEQVVVLLGATSGIGLETAMLMAERGASVAIVGRDQEGLNDAVDRVRSHAETSAMMRGRHNGNRYDTVRGEISMSEATQVAEIEEQVMGFEADITSFEQVKSVADQVVQLFGRIDTWVNVAAVSEWALFEDTTPDEFRRIIDVNLVGQAFGAMAALPYLKQQNGGAIIFVASIAGRLPIPYQSAYNASKHGLLGLAETLRLELKHTNVPVSVTTIIPSSINTPMFAKARTKLGVEPEPIPPIYDSKMVARAILYAAGHPVRELIVGDAGYAMTFMRRLAPTLTGNYMGATGFRQQRSNEPKSAQDPDNLYAHLSGYNEVQGEFTSRTRRFSPLTWLATHSAARYALIGLLVGGSAFLVGTQVIQNRRSRDWRYLLVRRTGKIAGRTGATITALPLISSLPMFRKKTIFEKIRDRMPFVNRRKSMMDRMTGVFSNISFDWLPWVKARQPLLVRVSDRLPGGSTRRIVVERVSDRGQEAIQGVSKQSRAAMKRLSKQTDETKKRLDEQRQEASRRLGESRKAAKERIEEQSKAAQGFISEKLPSKNDIKEMTQKTPMVVRRQSLVEKLPFGERREFIVERIPFENE